MDELQRRVNELDNSAKRASRLAIGLRNHLQVRPPPWLLALLLSPLIPPLFQTLKPTEFNPRHSPSG